MDEWLILTAIQRAGLEAIQIEKFCSGLEDLRHDGKLDSRNALPIVLVTFWADQRRSNGDEIRRTVVMVVVVMRDLKQKISRHGLVLVGISSSSDLLEGV